MLVLALRPANEKKIISPGPQTNWIPAGNQLGFRISDSSSLNSHQFSPDVICAPERRFAMDELDFQLEAGNPNTKIHFGVKIKLFLCRFTVRYKSKHHQCTSFAQVLCLFCACSFMQLIYCWLFIRRFV